MFSFKALLDELFAPGTAITGTAAQDINLGQFVAVSTNGTQPNPTVSVAPAGSYPLGLAQDAAEAGSKITVQRGNARCFRVPTNATITAGALLQVGANGQPEPATDGRVIAQALFNSADGHIDLTLI
ncbi:capsid cement protein [Corynebacterium pacaense]|uniref:capsid cement protein n=1 Tax=Corynebacterium pacaense TaxID=1816684 RepID=UPI0009BBB57E|nr:capsid cement protein [Corynebacterium pacaense]